jgi:Pectate lyase superfamily protein
MRGHVWLVLVIVFIVLSARSAVAQTPAQVASRIFNVRAFSAHGDGRTLDTSAISTAIRAANSAGGGTVLFPPGIYLTGTFELLENVTLNLQAGATILGSPNLDDYDSIAKHGLDHNYGTSSSGEGERVGIIFARNTDNIAIVGQGVIDGNADVFYDFKKPHFGLDFDPKYTRQGAEFQKSMLETSDGPVETITPNGRPGTMVIFMHCTNVAVRDVTFRNAPNWTFHMQNVTRGVANGLHIVNSVLLPNNDGVDCFQCKDVHFSDCDIIAGDDDFAFFGVENVSVTNCSLTSHSAGIRLENSHYSTFSNLVIHSNRGIGIFEREGKTYDLLFSNLVIDTQLLFGHWWGKAEPIFISIGPPRNGHAPGEVRDIRFSNIIGEAEGGIVLYGNDAADIRNIYIDHLKWKIRAPRQAVSEITGGNFDFRWTATNLSEAVFKHDIPGLYARHVDGLHLRDVTLEWGESLPGYFSGALEIEDFRNLDIASFEARQSPGSVHSPVIVLRNGVGVTLRDSRALEGTETFLDLTGVQGIQFRANNFSNARKISSDPEWNSETVDSH